MNNRPLRLAKPADLKPTLGLPACLLVVGLACCSSANAQTFVSFNATFDYGTLGLADKTTFQTTIYSALSFYSSKLQTSIPLTVNILFKADESVGLGQSSTWFNTVPYSVFRTALVANSRSAADTTALGFLPDSAYNPVNSSTTVTASLPLLRALGFTGSGTIAPGGFDGTVSLKTSIMNLDRSGPQNPARYDLQSTIQHEVNEVLGLNSQLNGLYNGQVSPTGSIGSLDLFRYNGVGSRSFTTALAEVSYLSYDNGVTQVTRFNQNQGGDFSDFQGGSQVQNAFGSHGAQADMGLGETTALDVIGYNFAAVPEPGELALAAAAALIGFAAVRKFRTA